jgi:hypothetical protein
LRMAKLKLRASSPHSVVSGRCPLLTPSGNCSYAIDMEANESLIRLECGWVAFGFSYVVRSPVVLVLEQYL